MAKDNDKMSNNLLRNAWKCCYISGGISLCSVYNHLLAVKSHSLKMEYKSTWIPNLSGISFWSLPTILHTTSFFFKYGRPQCKFLIVIKYFKFHMYSSKHGLIQQNHTQKFRLCWSAFFCPLHACSLHEKRWENQVGQSLISS